MTEATPFSLTRRSALRSGAAAGAMTLLPAAVSAGAPPRRADLTVPVDGGTLELLALSDRAVRVRFTRKSGRPLITMPEFLERPQRPASVKRTATTLTLPGLRCVFDPAQGVLRFHDASGRLLLAEAPGSRTLTPSDLRGQATMIAAQAFASPADERIFGTGGFQDGALDLRGLPRQLIQVNSQICLPFMLSSRGYGLLWHNTGKADFNVPEREIALARTDVEAAQDVNVTTSSGGAKVKRKPATFEGRFSVSAGGRHALLLDYGKMSSRHYLEIDGKVLADFSNYWLPPTVGMMTDLSAGEHHVRVIGLEEHAPVLRVGPSEPTTQWRSPVADSIDYVVIAGPETDAVMTGYRDLTGITPMMPRWAYGYIHCREHYVSQGQLLENAREFRRRDIPIDVIVQDWKYWGKYGWNAMQFDEANFPDPAAMVRDAHKLDMRVMLSVWSKIEKASDLGKQFEARGYYLPGSTWVDFFNKEAAAYYGRNHRGKLASLGFDAWWQDATEPENDDVAGRRTGAGPGERVRLTYPLQVTRTVFESQRQAFPDRRVMTLTRSAFIGQQRYAAATWSGDVGNDWETLRRQIASGLNMAAAGYPYWTVDAGGFFRPENQYDDPAYHERFLRWFQYATFLPLQRVHGFMTLTEPWHYGQTVERVFRDYVELRYRLMPYLYSMGADCWRTGTPLMRPLVFDFASDPRALDQKHSYMFGRALHVAPVTAEGVTEWPVYLPPTPGGWIDFWTGERRAGGQEHKVRAPLERIPLHVRAGSIVARGPVTQSTAESIRDRIELHVYPGADGAAQLHEDGGLDYGYERGEFALLDCRWHDADGTLELRRSGKGAASYASTRFDVLCHRQPGTAPSRRTVELRDGFARIHLS